MGQAPRKPQSAGVPSHEGQSRHPNPAASGVSPWFCLAAKSPSELGAIGTIDEERREPLLFPERECPRARPCRRLVSQVGKVTGFGDCGLGIADWVPPREPRAVPTAFPEFMAFLASWRLWVPGVAAGEGGAGSALEHRTAVPSVPTM